MASSTNEGDSDEEINYFVVQGQSYTIQVTGVNGDSNFYDLLIEGPETGASITPDRFESNNSFVTATSFSTLGDRNENDLSIHQAGNDDYYRFTADADASATIGISFTHAWGDLDLFFYDSTQTLLASSETPGDTETIVHNITDAAIYYVRVAAKTGVINPQYNLSINGPDVPAAPSVTSSSFAFEPRQQIQYNFDQDVSGSIDLADLEVSNTTTHQAIPASAFTVEVTNNSAGITTAIWKPNAPLPDGQYIVLVSFSGVTNGSGSQLQNSGVFPFFVLAGDATRDRKVDVADLGILASNWQQSPRTFSQGDFDYSGTVDVNDLGILASYWQQQLAEAPAFADSARRSAGISRVATEVL